MADETRNTAPETLREIDRQTPTGEMLAHAARQSRDKGLNDVLVIDVDAHHFEASSWAQVVEYIEDPVWRHIAKSFERPDGTNPGALSNYQPGYNYQHVGGRIPHSGGLRGEIIDDTSVHRDVILARRGMDALAIDYQVIFPTPMLGLGLHPSSEQEVALAFAYNRWLTQEVLPGDKRLTTMIYLPFSDPDASLRTVEEFAGNPGVAGFNVTSVRHKPVHHNQYMKVYAAIEEAGMPLGFHAGPTWDDQWMRQVDRFIGVHALSFVLCNMVHLTNWVLHGMQERFPNLPVIWIESGLAWVPFMMQRLDSGYMMRTSEAPELQRRPSDYMREMYYSSQPMERTDRRGLETTLAMINAETQLLYASDWPHWDFDLPSTIYDLPFLSEQAKRNILGESALKLFGLERPAGK
ncbi:MAG: amidohydrolase family protein [Nitrospinota bacterium]